MTKQEGPVAMRLFALKKSGDRVAFVKDGKGFILELKDILKKEIPPFEVFKSYVEKDFFEKKGNEALNNAITQAKETATKTGQLKDAHRYGVVQSLGWINPLDKKQIEDLSKAGFNQSILSLEKPGSVLAYREGNNGCIVRLEEVKPAEESQLEQSEVELKKSVFTTFNSLFQRSFIASLYRNAKIEFDITASAHRKNDSYEI